RDRIDPSPVGDGIFGIAAGARAHHAVAGLDAALRFRAALDHLARPFEADRRADASVAAVRQAAGRGEIGALERRGLDLHQHLVGFGPRLRDVAHDQSILARNAGLHRIASLIWFRALYCVGWVEPLARSRASSTRYGETHQA